MPRTLRLPALASLALAVVVLAFVSLPRADAPWLAPVSLTLVLTFVVLHLVLGPRKALAIYLAGALGVAALGLSGCGYTQLTRGAAKALPDYEIRRVPPVSCSDFLVRIDPEQSFSNSQQRAALKVCEEMTKGSVVRPSEVQDAMRASLPVF